jgi:hypothetical protein
MDHRGGYVHHRVPAFDVYLDVTSFQLELGDVLFDQQLDQLFDLFWVHSGPFG